MTAIPAERQSGPTFNLAFDYDPLAAPAEGDRVEIYGSRKVRPITQIGGPCEIGECIAVRQSLVECTVRVDGSVTRLGRIAGEAVVAGRGVFGPGNKVYQYHPATPAKHIGTAVGPATVVAATSDAIKIRIEEGAFQTITLTAGVNRTFAAIAAEVNPQLTDLHLEVDADGHLNPVANRIDRAIEIAAVTHDAYTLFGWTAGVYNPTTPSHDPAVTCFILVGAAKDSAIETLEE
jgi:hypothetical protein